MDAVKYDETALQLPIARIAGVRRSVSGLRISCGGVAEVFSTTCN